jgi:methionyl-tRNA formyltransferase
MEIEPRIAIFADRVVGEKVIRFLLASYREDVRFIVVTDENSVAKKNAIADGFDPSRIFTNEQLADAEVRKKFEDENLDYIILAWWPFIIRKEWMIVPREGIINFHPSLLPYNRGKNYNFWTLVEDSPFGVSLHFIDETIDGGDVIFQKKITKTWEDNGETLYVKAQSAMVELFTENYDKIRSGNYKRIKQDLSKGSFHYSKDMAAASEIKLGSAYQAKDLLNLLRAKTFPPHPAAWFEDKGEKYQVTINIQKI